jgi:AcrR family transcriptional regulator
LRDAGAHEATLTATRELLREVGYARLTVENIARRAGVAKPTIYRWWPNKAAIVHEAVWSPRTEPRPDTGSLIEDLRAYISHVVAFFSRKEVVAALPGLVDQSLSAEGPATSMLADYSRASMRPITELLVRARDRGELRESVDIGMLSDVIIGAMLSRILARAMRSKANASMRPSDVDALLDIVLNGVLADAGR